MPKVIFLPFNIEVSGLKGKSILDLAFENDIIIEHNCGGLCACTSCKVIIKQGLELLNEKSLEEKYLLDIEGFVGNEYRLSCQSIIEENSENKIIVKIPQ